MPDNNQQQNAGFQQQQNVAQQQRQQPEQQLQPRQPQPQEALQAVASCLHGRPAASELGHLIKQLMAQGRIDPDELGRIRDLVQRSCGNDYSREVFSRAGLNSHATPLPGQVQGPGAAPLPPPDVTGSTPAKPPLDLKNLQQLKDAGFVRPDFAPGSTSMQLNRALDKWFADKETIWKLLEGCNRDETELLQQAYSQVYKKDLLGHLKEKMSGSDLRRAYTPFGRAHEVPETTMEKISRKTGEAAGWVRDKTSDAANTVKDTATNVINAEKEGLAVLADMASIIKDLGLNPLTGEGTVTVDAGKAFFYLAPHLPPHLATMFSIDPAAAGANKVSFYVNLKERRASLHADSLAVRGMSYPNFFSSACTLNAVDLNVGHFNPLKPTASGSTGVATIQSATMLNPVFTTKPLAQGALKQNQIVNAREVYLTGLKVNAASVAKPGSGGVADGLVSQLSFDQAKVLGLNYPGLVPVDAEIKQAGLNFETLWDVLGNKATDPSAPGGAELPATPSVLPPGSRIQLNLNGIYGAAALRQDQAGGNPAAAGQGGFAGCRIALLQEGKELAVLDIKGFEARAGRDELGGTIQSLTATGEPQLLKTLLEARELQATPQVRQAVEVIKKYGIEATVGGKLALSNVGFERKGGAEAARADLNANLQVPDVGAVDLAVKGFSARRDGSGNQADFERFEARLTGPGGAAASFLMEGQGPGAKAAVATQTGGTTSLSAKKIATTGDAARLSALFQALQAKVKSLPPAMGQVFDLVKNYGAAFGATGGLELTDVAVRGEAGRTTATANVQSRIELPGVGTIELGVAGLNMAQAAGATGVDFSRLQARLISAATKNEVAALTVEGDSASREARLEQGAARVAPLRATVKGNTKDAAVLIRSLQAKAGSVAGLQGALDRVMAQVPLLEALAASGELQADGLTLTQQDGKTVVGGDLGGRIQAPGVGTVDVSVKGYRGDPTNPASLRFDRFEANLTDQGGGRAAHFLVQAAKERADQPSFGDGKSFAVDKVELQGSSKHLASLLGALQQKVGALPKGVQGAFELARTYGGALDAGGDVTLTQGELDLSRGGAGLRGDIQANVNLADVGNLNVAVTGFEIGKSTVNFQTFVARLNGQDGKEAASVVVEADRSEAERVALEGGIPQKVKSLKVSGSTANVARLLQQLQAKAPTLPEPVTRTLGQVDRFLATYKVDGSIAVEDLTIEGPQGQGQGPAGGGPSVWQGETLRIGSSGAAVRELQTMLCNLGHPVEVDGSFGPATDRAVRAFQEKMQLGVDGKAGQGTFTAMQQAARGRGGAPGPAPAGPTETTNVSFTVPVNEGSVLSQALQKGSKIGVELKGFRGPSHEQRIGYDALDVKVLGPDGKRVAGLSLKGVEGWLGKGAGGLKLGSFNVDGDGQLIAAAMAPDLLARMPEAARHALTSVENLQLSVGAGQFAAVEQGEGYSGYRGEFADINLSGGISLTDKEGHVYECEQAQLKARAPKVSLDRSFKLQELTSEKLEGSGRLVRSDGAVQVAGRVFAKNIKAVMGPDGKPVHFEASDVLANGDVETTSDAKEQTGAGPTHQSREDRLAGLAQAQGMAQTGAALLKDAELHTSTPMNPGKFGSGMAEVEVPSGTTLNADLVVKNRQLVVGANGTRVSFSNGLRGPLGIKVGGAYTEQEGARGLMKLNLKGFFDLNQTDKMTGKSTMALKVGELVNEVMNHQRAAVEKLSPRDEERSDEKKRQQEAELARKHDEWSRNRDEKEADFGRDRAELEADRKKWNDKVARRRAEARNADELARVERDDREEQADFDRKLARLDSKLGEKRTELAEEEPRSMNVADLFGPRGMDPFKTSGSAAVTMASEGGKDRELAPGVMLPGNQEINLRGQASGSGTMNLTADSVAALLYGQQISAAGLRTGDVQVNMNQRDGKSTNQIQFSSFYLKRLDWRQQAPKK